MPPNSVFHCDLAQAILATNIDNHAPTMGLFQNLNNLALENRDFSILPPSGNVYQKSLFFNGPVLREGYI